MSQQEKVMQQTTGRADLHMHTQVSDGNATVQQLTEYLCREQCLDVIAITDHDRLDASLWAYERQEQFPFEVIIGMEVSSSEGHVLAYGISELIPAHLSLAETVQAIHEANGIAVLAHPFHIHVQETRAGFPLYRNNPQYIEEIGFDGVEVVNAGMLIPGANRWSQWACKSLNVAKLGNSDAHTLNAINSASTNFPGKTAAELLYAIKNRTTSENMGIWSPMAYYQYIYHCTDASMHDQPLDQPQETVNL